MSETKNKYNSLTPSYDHRGVASKLLIGGTAVAATFAGVEGFTALHNAVANLDAKITQDVQVEHVEVRDLGEPQNVVVHIERLGE